MGRPSRPRQRLTDLLRRVYNAQERRLAAQRNRTLGRLNQAYRGYLARISDELRTLTERASTPGMSARELRRIGALTRLQDAMRIELRQVAQVLGSEAAAMQASGIDAGLAAGMTALRGVGLDSALRPTLDMLTQVVNYTSNPVFRANLQRYGDYHAEHIADILLTAEDRGIGPLAAAREIRLYARNMPLADAVRTTRTLQLYSARAAQRETFRANSDVVMGWWWSSALDATTCESCWSLHGSVHDLDETLNDHHAGRCAPVPITRTIPGVPLEQVPEPTDGETAFRALSDTVQKEIMGEAKWSAWRDGQFEFSDLSRTYEDNVYGSMRRAATLAELVGKDMSMAYRRAEQ